MLNRRGERRDIFSCLNTYDVFFVLLEEERHRKGDGGQLILILLPVKRSSKDGLIPKRRTVTTPHGSAPGASQETHHPAVDVSS